MSAQPGRVSDEQLAADLASESEILPYLRSCLQAQRTREYLRELQEAREALRRIAYEEPPESFWKDGSASEGLEWGGKIAREALGGGS